MVAMVITMLDQTLAKWSICALYYRIFRVNRTNAKWIQLIAVLQGVTYIVLFFTQLFVCRPIEKWWKPWLDGYCIPESTIVLIVEPPNSLLDFALVALAIYMIQDLHVSKAIRWKLRFLFGLGSL